MVLRRLSLPALALLAQPALANNPLLEFLPKVVQDEFNPDVTAADRAAGIAGVRGGRLRLRNPVDFGDLNALTATGQPERVVINHMADSLVDRDPETLEYYPEQAWHWLEADRIKLVGAEPMNGRIVARDETTITFAPGAWRRIHALSDVAAHNAEQGWVELSAERGGARHRGTVTVLQHTVVIDEAATTGTLTIPLSEIDNYTITLGDTRETLPWIKPSCVYEFHIRPGVTWHDGRPFTARDVEFSFRMLMNPAADTQAVRSLFEDVESCAVVADGAAVRFVIRQPYFQVLSAIAGEGSVSGNAWVVPRHVFDPDRFGGDEQALAQAFNAHPFRTSPIYTGPYRLKEWKQGESLTLIRNAGYWKNRLPEGSQPRWNTAQPYLDEITWTIYKEAAASTRDLMSGKLDADLDVEPQTWILPETKSPEFLARMVRTERVGFLFTYIGWNMRNPIFQDPEVRRALAMLIPREEIAAKVHYGVAFPTDGPFYFRGPGYDTTIEPIRHDPRRAMQILARAGWRDRDGDGIREKEINGTMVPLRFEYAIHNARDYHQKIADIIKENLEAAGIQVSISRTEWAIFLKKIREKSFDAVRLAWGTAIDPDPFAIFHSSQIENDGNNFVSYRNPEVDALCVRLRREMDPAKRWEIAREIHRIIHRDQPLCFLFGFKETYFVSRGLRGVRLYANTYPVNYTEWWWANTR
jgi:peptide/nickel transport system substrate-binding protein